MLNDQTKPEIKIEGELKIGEYVITGDEYGGVPWIRHDSGEGMGMSPPTVQELLEVIEKFYRDNL